MGENHTKKFRFKKKDWLLIGIIVVVAGAAFLFHELIGGEGAGVISVKVDGCLLYTSASRVSDFKSTCG